MLHYRKDTAGKTVLHHSAWYNNKPMCLMLLERGADPSAIDNDGKTPAEVADESDSGVAAHAIRVWVSRMAAMHAVAELCLG